MKRLFTLYSILLFVIINSTSGQTNYTFNGNGNWSDSLNWVNYLRPPSILKVGSQITINPAINGICILDTLQMISGGTLVIAPGKRFTIVKDLNLLQNVQLVSGKLLLPTGSSVNMSDYEVHSISHSSKVHNDGSFEIVIPDSSNQQIIVVTNSSNDVTMLGYFNGEEKEYLIDGESTTISLLVMYPFLKPVSDTANARLINAYKMEGDFNNLKQKVESLLKNGSNLFDSANTALAELVINLVQKNYYGDIVRARPLENDPIDITTNGNIIMLHNNTTYSYAGGLYRNNQNIKAFLLAGSTLADSRFYQVRPGYELPPEDMRIDRSLDLKTFGTLPGSYEVKLRSGLAYDGTDEDDLAFSENTYELFISIVDNLIPSKLIKLSDDCLSEFFNHLVKVAKTQFKNDPNSDFMKDIAIPIFSDYSTIAKECSGSKVNDYLGLVFKYLKDFKKASGPLATLYFNAEWVLRAKAVDACKVLDDKGQVDNCFVFQKVDNIDAKSYICDTIDLKIKALEDIKFYPYEGKPIPNLDFVWLSTEGNGVFLPTKSINEAGKTNQDGEASIRWVLPDNPTKNSAEAVTYVGSAKIASTNFNTSSQISSPTIKVLAGNNQSGTPGNVLPGQLQLSVLDRTDNLPMHINRFFTKWTVEKGTGTIRRTVSSTPFDSSFLWTLGPEEGEQSVKCELFSKTCDGIIQENPVTFKATAGASVSISTNQVTSISQTTAVSGGNITDDGGSPITARGVCWSSYQNPTIVNDKTTDGSGTGQFTSNISGLTNDLSYFVRAYATNSLGTSYGNEINFTAQAPSSPNLTTINASNITETSVVSGGNITSDKGIPIIARGVCWSESYNPTIENNNNKTNDGTGIGTFTSIITGLSGGTKYYVRAYATSSNGMTGYGDEVVFITKAPEGWCRIEVFFHYPAGGPGGGEYVREITGNGGIIAKEGILGLVTLCNAEGETASTTGQIGEAYLIQSGVTLTYYQTSEYCGYSNFKVGPFSCP